MAALEELRQFVAESNGIAEFQVYAMEARIAVFSGKPGEAKKFYGRAVARSRYAEPVSAERILREFAALCARESYAITRLRTSLPLPIHGSYFFALRLKGGQRLVYSLRSEVESCPALAFATGAKLMCEGYRNMQRSPEGVTIVTLFIARVTATRSAKRAWP